MKNQKTLSPFSQNWFSPWENILDSDSFMETFFGFFPWENLKRKNLRKENRFLPNADIQETDHYYLMEIDLPGVSKKDIDINITEDHHLIIKGERKRTLKNTSKDHFYHLERETGSFIRSFKLPESIDTSNLKAHYKNGTLCVTIPKKPIEKKTKAIPIEEGAPHFWSRLLNSTKKEEHSSSAQKDLENN